MRLRHPQNKNLILTNESDLYGLPSLPEHGPYIESYLDRVLQVVNRFVEKHPRATAIRFDLRIPANSREPESDVITRFFDSLKGRLANDQLRNARKNHRVRSPDIAYIWMRKKSTSMHHHYHCCILVDGDAYYHLGSFKQTAVGIESRQNMALRICHSWAGALRLGWEDARGLVHLSQNGVHHLSANSDDFVLQLGALIRRLSYFAKPETKHYGNGNKYFGSSRKYPV